MVSRKEFLVVLEKLKDICSKQIKSDKIHFKSGTDFQSFVFENLNALVQSMKIKTSRLNLTGVQSFPDIVIDDFGIEVKLANKESWQTTGNSILESTRVAGVTEIYFFFLLQRKDSSEIRFRLYEECLADIVVTHSPRFLVDLDIDKNQTILKKLKTNYDDFIKNAPIKKVKEYYKKAGKQVWWIDEESEQTSPIEARTFDELSLDEKKLFMAKTFIFSPEVFSNSNKKFTKALVMLIQEFDCLPPNGFRDIFTAGGQVRVKINGKNQLLPQIYSKYIDLLPLIKENLENITQEEIEKWSDLLGATPKSFQNLWLTEMCNSAKSDIPRILFFSK